MNTDNDNTIPGDFTTPDDENINENEVEQEVAKQQHTEEKKAFSDKTPTNSERRENFRKTVTEFSVSMYTYAANVKSAGHISLAEQLFKQTLKVIVCTNAASAALTHDRFVSLLEEGYYATTFLEEYMEYVQLVGCDSVMHEPLIETLHRIQKGLASSVKTSRGRKPAMKGVL